MGGTGAGGVIRQQQQQRESGMVDSSGNLDANISISALDVVPSYTLLNAMARYWLDVLEEVVGVGNM